MKALIVEDEMVVARHLAIILKNVGYDVCDMVSSVGGALDSIKRYHPDVVLIDIILEGNRDGIDLAHALRTEYRLPFLFITSHADYETVKRAKEASPNGYLVKPFTPEEVYVATEIALVNFANAQPGHHEWAGESEGGLPQFRLKKVTSHINDHLDGDLTLAELAEVAGLSKYYFSRLFKEAVGMPPYEYVLECRVGDARRRLKETRHTITQIALQTGFSGPSHLGRVFRERVGLSPSAYRKSRHAAVERQDSR